MWMTMHQKVVTDSSWATAHKYPQDDYSCGIWRWIWVAEGTYKPDQGAGKTAGIEQYFCVGKWGWDYGGFLRTESTNKLGKG